LNNARKNKVKIDWRDHKPVEPGFVGEEYFLNYDLSEIVPVIDWTPFFSTWELKGQYPRILDDDKMGEAARGLFSDAQNLLQQIIDEKWLTANAAIGIWPANSVDDDDIEIYKDAERSGVRARFHTLRQQIARNSDRANAALADFIAPKESGLKDYLGGFAVTAGIGENEIAKRFAESNDDYGKIMVKALADRLAEGFAELMHRRIRTEFWGYATNESLSNEDLITEKYQGIRPAPGYPAQPDHTEKGTLFDVLRAEEKIGIKLTESFAMWPGSSVSGLYFSHPKSHYFGVGKIDRDQVEDYARRKGWDLEKTEKWLAPILNYDPRKFVSAA